MKFGWNDLMCEGIVMSLEDGLLFSGGKFRCSSTSKPAKGTH